MGRKPRPKWWVDLEPLDDELVAWWQNELKLTDQLSSVKRHFLAALNELAARRAVERERQRYLSQSPVYRFLERHRDTIDLYRGIRLRNVTAGIVYQGVWNFLVTFNGWGIFRRRSHFNASGKEKISHLTSEQAWRHAISLQGKRGGECEAYKCIFCDAHHVGRNR